MSSVFSGFVQSLRPEGPPLEPAAFGRLLEKLRGALVYELKKRSLWSSPPSYLGIYGGAQWTDGDLLEELLLDCYLFIFIRRLPGLKRQLALRSNIDGLIFLNIRNFLYDTQRRHDPLGFRVFEVLQTAVLRLLEDGVLHLLAGNAKVRNDTLLGFSTWHGTETVGDVDLRPQVIGWNDDLLPDLITAWNKEDVQERLAEKVARLPEEGIETFRFQDLIDPLKNDARGRWQAIHLVSEGEEFILEGGDDFTSIVRWVLPDLGFEERESFQKLADCMDDGIDQLETRKKTKEYLRRLWLFFRQWAAEPEAGISGESVVAVDRNSKSIPSDVKLGENLGIPRGRIPSLKATLGRMVETCHETTSGSPADIRSGAGMYASEAGQPSSASLEEGAVMDVKTRREQLRMQTDDAVARLAKEDGRLADREAELPRPGELFFFAEISALPVEWVFLEVDEAVPPRALVMPVDDQPYAGSRDVKIEETRIRCGLATWLDAEVLDPERRIGVLGADSLERARLKWSELMVGAGHAPESKLEVDASPRYQSWIDMLDKARTALHGNPQPVRLDAAEAEERAVEKDSSTVVPFERPDRRAARPFWQDYRLGYGIAAVFAAAVVGFTLWVGQLRDKLDQPLMLQTKSAPEVVFLGSERRIKMSSLAATETHVGLYLIFSQVKEFSSYRLELLSSDDQGAVVWKSNEIVGRSEFLLILPRRLVTDGMYLLRLYGRDEEGSEHQLDEREVEVELQ